MIIASTTNAGSRSRRSSVRAPRTRVRGWTGRAAVSLPTDSAVPTFVLAGTRKSRVSDLRLVRGVVHRTGPVTISNARRSCGHAGQHPAG